LCGDLQVLGRSEFKQLLKWRLHLKKALAAELTEAGYTEEKALIKSAGGNKKLVCRQFRHAGYSQLSREIDAESQLRAAFYLSF
jgi:hypothetical protein